MNKTKVIKVLSYLGLTYAALGWLNEVLFHWADSLLFIQYSEYIVIGIFGIYRMVVGKDPYTRKRVTVLTVMVKMPKEWILKPAVLRFAPRILQ